MKHSSFIFFILSVLISTPAFPIQVWGEESSPSSAENETNSEDESSANIEDFFGKYPRNGLIVLPVGIHTHHPETGLSNNNLIGIVHSGFYAGTFINSFGDRVWSAGMTRELFKYGIFGVDYYLGLMVGYNGKLADVGGIPFRHTVLFRHDLNPIGTLDLHIDVSEYFELRTFLTPLVALAGVKIYF